MRRHVLVLGLLVASGLVGGWFLAGTVSAADNGDGTYSFHGSGWVPGTRDGSNVDAVELGMRFTLSEPGSITALRFYKDSADSTTHTGSLWLASTGERLATGTYSGETSSGWQTLTLSSPVEVAPGTEYVVSYTTSGPFVRTAWFFTEDITSDVITAIGGGNGVFRYGDGSVMPSSSSQVSDYGADVVFEPEPDEPDRDWTGFYSEPGFPSTPVHGGDTLTEVTVRGNTSGGMGVLLLTGTDLCSTTLTVVSGDVFRANCPGDAFYTEGQPVTIAFAGEFRFTLTGTGFQAQLTVPPVEYGGAGSIEGEYAVTVAEPTTTTTTSSTTTTTVLTSDDVCGWEYGGLQEPDPRPCGRSAEELRAGISGFAGPLALVGACMAVIGLGMFAKMRTARSGE